MAMFYSETPLEIKDVENHGRVIIQPGKSPSGLPPNVTLLATSADATADLIDVSQFLDDYGQEYEVQFYTQGAFSYASSSPNTDLNKIILQWQFAAAIIMAIFLFALHGDLIFYFKHKND